jgi:hypothetical protein
MALLLIDDSVFLHVPKAGGTWVTRVLREAGLVRFRFSHKHGDLERVVNFGNYYPWQYVKRTARAGPLLHRRVRAAYKFTFVRHPLAWYRSYFMYMVQLDWKRHGGLGIDPWHPYAALYDLRADTFAGFAANVVERAPGFVSAMYRRYTEPGVDFVGRQESLASDLVHVMRARGYAFDEASVRSRRRENVSSRSRTLALPRDLRAALIASEAEAIQRYGYGAERIPAFIDATTASE